MFSNLFNRPKPIMLTLNVTKLKELVRLRLRARRARKVFSALQVQEDPVPAYNEVLRAYVEMQRADDALNAFKRKNNLL